MRDGTAVKIPRMNKISRDEEIPVCGWLYFMFTYFAYTVYIMAVMLNCERDLRFSDEKKKNIKKSVKNNE